MADHEDREGFGRALAAARKNRHLSQERLGQLLDSTVQSTVSAWEKGKTVPDKQTVFRLEELLELPPGYLSSHLGYAPESSPSWGTARLPRTPECIANDPDLNAFEKNLLLALYREIRAHHAPRETPLQAPPKKPRRTSG